MDREKVDAMTADEVRIAVAKAQGWEPNKLCDNTDIGEDYDGWQCVNCGAKGDWEDENYPDHYVPMPDCCDPRWSFILMDEVWKKEPDAMIWKDKGTYTVCFRVLQSPKPHIRILTKELWEAIARAWLIICADQDSEEEK